MTEPSKDLGIIAVLCERFATQRLPRALALKEKVDKGELLSDWDAEYLENILEDDEHAKPFVDEHPELQTLYAQAAALYEEITDRALENEQRSVGTGQAS